MNDGQTLHNSPYVEQIERFAGSVKQLSQIFLGLEEKKQAFSDEEIEMMFRRLKEKVCSKCEKCEWCWGENFIHTYQMGYEVLSAVDHYGNDLNTETKRKLMQRCIMAPRFLREMLEGFHDARQNMIWINRIARSREGCAIQLDTFADMLQSSARELEESIFTDERMERRISGQLKKAWRQGSVYAVFHEPGRKIRSSCDCESDAEKENDCPGTGAVRISRNRTTVCRRKMTVPR